MDKHEALIALEEAHKHREHARRLEAEAHRLLKEGGHDEHEATASAAHDRLGVKHSHLAALHTALSNYHDNRAAESHGREAHKHVADGAKHDRAAQVHFEESSKALAPHGPKRINAVHKHAIANIDKKFGDALFHHEHFDHHGARAAIKKLAR